jgi:hypothetical protein
MLALSPDGSRLMTFDSDSGVLRAYLPESLTLTHQRFVSDLLSAAEELQLTGFADLPPTSAALSALAVSDQGHFAFAVSGQVCASPVQALTPTGGPPPGPQPVTIKSDTVKPKNASQPPKSS